MEQPIWALLEPRGGDVQILVSEAERARKLLSFASGGQ